MIDLHCHSTASDGTDTPSQIIEKAHKIGLKAIALTDHDVIDGLEEFQKAAALYPDLWAINGTELAVAHPQAEIEILALNIQNIAPFKERQKKLIQARDEAHKLRLELLKNEGIELTTDDLYFDEKGNRRTVVGRPHIAMAMLKKGYVTNIQEAFDKYLKKGCRAYVPKQNPPLRETIEFIVENGAVASLAHPVHTRVEDEELFKLLKEMKSYGLQAVECYHSDHSSAQINKYLFMAEKLELASTGGSDYHGTIHPDVELGFGKGELNIPDSLLEIFVKEKAHVRSSNCNQESANTFRPSKSR